MTNKGNQCAPTGEARAPVPALLLAGSTETNLDRLQREAFLRGKGIDPKAPIQFDIWPDEVREIPNDYARSAIFTVRNKKEPRQSLQNSILFHTEKAVKVTFTGIELRADDDELVWQQILNYAKHYPLGEPVEFNLHQLCKDIGWSVNARNYERLRICITRLKANEIKVENARLGKGVGISLIREYEFDGAGDKGTKYRVWIHPNLIILFAGKNSTRIAWTQYREVTPVARRLYDYLASHKQPFPLHLDTFYQMCGSSCDTPRKWKQMVQQACLKLVKTGMVKKAWVRDDSIFFER
jgi:hypothetical protein